MLIYSISNHEYDIYMSFSLALISRERNSNGWLNGIAEPYDSYVEKVLCFYRDRDGFAQFKREALKDYVSFKGALIDFRAFYGLGRYDLKQIDKYIWQLGKEYFPKTYGKSK